MPSTTTLPRIHLRRGDHAVEVLDPRSDARALGTRYGHGGYIHSWRVGERRLTAGPTRHWDDFNGCGLPETFELPVAWAHAKEHEPFLRLGAGQMRKNGPVGDDRWLRAALTAVLEWEIIERSDDRVVMRSDDALESDHWKVGYDIVREVRVHDDGVESRTTLTLRCAAMMQHPVSWFAHPFFRQTAVGATSLDAPGTLIQRTPMPPRRGPNFGPSALARGEDGRWRFGEGYPRAVLGDLWGLSPELQVHLDPALGGGRVGITVDRPLDHLVVWANELVFSPETKLCRLWQDGETASWSIRYRFTP